MNRNLLRSTIHTSAFPQFGAEKDIYEKVERIQLYKRIDKLTIDCRLKSIAIRSDHKSKKLYNRK